MSSDATAPRRIAVALDGPGTPRWQERALERLRAEPGLEVAEVRLAGTRRRGIARRLHEAVERRLFALGPEALDPVAVERVAVDPSAPPGGREQPSLLVWLAESTPAPRDAGPVLELCHDGRAEPAEEAFRRAVLRGAPTVATEAVLRDGERVVTLRRTVSGARPYSSTLSRDKALWKIAAMAARAAATAGGEAGRTNPAATAEGLAGSPHPGTASGRAPSDAELLLRSPWRWLRVVAARLAFERPWQIRVRERASDPVAGWSAAPERPVVRWADRHLYADPMLFEHEGHHHLFCEDLAPGSNRAVISHVALAPGSAGGSPRPVLQAPHHLSYPYVFAHGGEVFMIPESSAERRVELYRAERFPDEWTLDAVLLDGVIASDATLLEHEGRLWLFACVTEPGATLLDELHLFWAERLAGPWHPHPLNPVVSDVACARPAGAVQVWGGRLVRPAQDCSRRYGGAVSFREIDVLSESEYAEHEIARIDPAVAGRRTRAVHTYAADRLYEAIDLRSRRLRARRPAVWSGP
ncbi:MAG TPA: hypothetical protein VN618_09855 [Solirubrobacteraceae bacterium]|nr:hypothetical protein [Solirubrobacteraceae bacterium]